MKITQTTIFLIIIIILVLGAVITFMATGSGPKEPGKYDAFTTCLKEKGTVFYGAWWCTHCKANKKLFGSSADLLPYVECSSKDGKEQLQICKDKNIQGYPTWEFSDGSRLEGEQSLEVLAEKTSCQLPQ